MSVTLRGLDDISVSHDPFFGRGCSGFSAACAEVCLAPDGSAIAEVCTTQSSVFDLASVSWDDVRPERFEALAEWESVVFCSPSGPRRAR